MSIHGCQLLRRESTFSVFSGCCHFLANQQGQRAVPFRIKASPKQIKLNILHSALCRVPYTIHTQFSRVWKLFKKDFKKINKFKSHAVNSNMSFVQSLRLLLMLKYHDPACSLEMSKSLRCCARVKRCITTYMLFIINQLWNLAGSLFAPTRWQRKYGITRSSFSGITSSTVWSFRE